MRLLRHPGLRRLLTLPALLLAGFLLSGFTALEAWLAPDAKLQPRWATQNEASEQQVSHAAWGRFLERYREVAIDGTARFAYHRVSDADRTRLADYIERLQGVMVSRLNRNEQFAYWVNLYNAATVQLVLDYRPEKSIREIDISPGLFSSGPWDKELLRVEGAKLSLNDIEHGILRPIWRDARTHYVLNCASLGCPDIPAEPLTAANREELLDQAARNFINHPRAVRIEGDNATLSSIYLWFVNDFGGSDAALLDHLRTYAGPELRKALMKVRAIKGYSYDWSLNAVPVVTTASGS